MGVLAMEFYDKFHLQQEHFFHEYLEKLRMIRKREHMETNELVSSLRFVREFTRQADDIMMHASVLAPVLQALKISRY